MSEDLELFRMMVCDYAESMCEDKLTPGQTGNISARDPSSGLIAITPSGADYLALCPDDICIVSSSGELIDGEMRPSSEAGMHLEIYKARTDINGIVHTHSTCATTLACLGIELPAVHYMLALAGTKVPLVDYHTYGTDQLAKAVANGLQDHNACLIRNHGVVACGETLDLAYTCAQSVEFGADIFLKATSVGIPNTLPADEMQRVADKLRTYGQPPLPFDF